MTGTLIASTPKASMHALAFQGIMVYNSFPQIRDMLLRRFGDDYVLLFCRPVENSAEGVIDWYSPVQGNARPLATLPDDQRNAISARIMAMAGEILNFANELIATGDPLKITRGNILRLALKYPDDTCLFVVGEQPVFTCWGFGPGTSGVEGKDLARLAVPPSPSKKSAAPLPLSAATPASARAGGGWLWWILPFFLGALLFILLFSGFGSWPALSGFTLFSMPAPAFLNEGEDQSAAIKEAETALAQTEARLNDHIRLCVPKKAESQQLVIPKNAQDTGFMAGKWLCETGLASATTNEPVSVTFNFDKNGKGTSTIYEQDDHCTGAATASMTGNVLKIDVGTQQCAKSGREYMPLTIQCESAANRQTECKGLNQDGTGWTANFRKAR